MPNNREEFVTFRLPIEDLYKLSFHLRELRDSQGSDMFSEDYYSRDARPIKESLKILDKMIAQISPNYPSEDARRDSEGF